jgi:protein-S-isoprenylcysteine O-methyltransferase Ste14
MTIPDSRPNLILRIPPPIWAVAMLLAAYGLERSFTWASVVYSRAPNLGILLAVAGISFAVWGRNIFAAAGTEIMPTSPSNKKLVTSGPFRFSRNPMYLGLVLVTLGIAFYAGTLPFYAVPVLLFLLCNFVFIPFEEAKMQRQFNAQYTDYRSRVRRWV